MVYGIAAAREHRRNAMKNLSILYLQSIRIARISFVDFAEGFLNEPMKELKDRSLRESA